jgi:hypothetical protein
MRDNAIDREAKKQKILDTIMIKDSGNKPKIRQVF